MLSLFSQVLHLLFGRLTLFGCFDLVHLVHPVHLACFYVLQAVCCKSSATTKIHLLFQIFDYNHDGVLSRPELLLLLRSSVTGVRKLCGFPPLSTNILEQLVSHAFATSSSAAQQKEAGMNFRELSLWARMNNDVKAYFAAVSPPTIHAAQMQRKKKVVHHGNISHNGGGVKNQEVAIEHPFRNAVLAHRKHVSQYLPECKELYLLFAAMDEEHKHRVTLAEFTKSLPATLKPHAPSMFAAMCNGKYLHFDQMLHEVYPFMTHDEIDMLCAATRIKKKRIKKPKVKLSQEQTEEMNALFDMYDTDHSGTMSVAELTAGMTATGAFSLSECKAYFDEADLHHHHYLTRADFIVFFEGFFLSETNLFRLHPDDLTPLDAIPSSHLLL